MGVRNITFWILMIRTTVKYVLLYLISVVTIYLLYQGLGNVFPIERKLVIKASVMSIGVLAGLLLAYNFEKLKRKSRSHHRNHM
jgi:hypothetical protein